MISRNSLELISIIISGLNDHDIYIKIARAYHWGSDRVHQNSAAGSVPEEIVRSMTVDDRGVVPPLMVARRGRLGRHRTAEQ